MVYRGWGIRHGGCGMGIGIGMLYRGGYSEWKRWANRLKPLLI